jgi:hypothetical protein
LVKRGEAVMKPVLHLLNNGGWQPASPTLDNLYLESVAWNFISSFKKGILRSTLEGSFFKIRDINYEIDSKLISGRCLCITNSSWKDYGRLLAKWKPLGYRLKKLNPEIGYLWLQDPDRITSLLIDLRQQEALNIALTKRSEG